MSQVRFDRPSNMTVLATFAGAILAVAAGMAANTVRGGVDRQAQAEALTGGITERAPVALRRYGCAGCHEIAGIPGADGRVGGSLDALRERIYIAGVVSNTPENLTRWIVDPQAFSPHSAMPATGITRAEARDVAAYLYSH